MKTIATFVAVTLSASLLLAQNDPPKEAKDQPAPATVQEALAKYAPVTGIAKVGKVATIRMGEGWSWLDGAKGRQFLQDLGNRPGLETLGVAIPPDFLESNTFAVYSYADEGHVADDESPDYGDLLVQMKQASAEDSKARKKAGLQGVELIGWAEPPHYDKDQHKLYWAEQLRFDGEEGDTLNYNVRVLGRTGHLVVNGVGDLAALSTVAAHSKALLGVTEFVDGQRYTDFKPEYDKLAAYGIGGLVAGKVALKVGLFAVLAKFAKFIVIGVLLAGGAVWKMLTGRKKDDTPPSERRPVAS